MHFCIKTGNRSSNRSMASMKREIDGNCNSFSKLSHLFPHRTVRNSLKLRAAPWFTRDLKKLIRVKNRLFKKACSSGTDNHWETYRSARNKATREFKKAKLDYVKRQANTLWVLTKSATFQDGGELHEISVDSRARGIRVCHLSWTNQRTFSWTIKRKPIFWTTSLLTRTHPLLLKPFFLGRHLYEKRLTWIVYRQRQLLRLWDLCRISPRAGATKSLIAWWRRLALLSLVRL